MVCMWFVFGNFDFSPKVLCLFSHGGHLRTKLKGAGLVRDLNPGPLAPKARIIPLDQQAST